MLQIVITTVKEQNVMRHLTILAIFITIFFISCKDKSTQPEQTKLDYNQMLFERLGGGNLIFHASATSSEDTLQVNVTQMAYRDTSIQITIARNPKNTGILDTLIQALSGTIQLAGSFKQDTAAIAGTWTYVYMVNGNGRMEVTNITLRNVLLELEPIVVATL